MTWELSADISLRNDRVLNADADRQMRTAAEILHRLATQPGLVLADEVGMGKTYVALAVAVSVLNATKRRRPVVVMVPAAVAEKWPTEWAVFADRCLPRGHGLRASGAVRTGSDFLKLLDDPPSSRKHLIFLTHGALSGSLRDPFIRLALIRQATKGRKSLLLRRPAIARAAKSLLNDPRFGDPDMVEHLLATPEASWRNVWEQWRPHQVLDDDPVPAALLEAFKRVDLGPVREALLGVPVNQTTNYNRRLKQARSQLQETLKQVWVESLGALEVRLPLLVLDEAHHVKNPNRLARLFANEEAERDADALQGPLGKMFEKMLFLTATPFQLGHHELLQVLERFHGVRWPSKLARTSFDEETASLRSALDRAQSTALRFERAWSRIDVHDAGAVAALSSFECHDTQPELLRTALAIGDEARADKMDAERLLRPWVIRHVKPHKAKRRQYRPGRSILDDLGTDTNVGLPVSQSTTLPFLLAARAQAVASSDGPDGERSARAYYAYGLASSFEAYADTRRNRGDVLDDLDQDSPTAAKTSPQLRWYLERIAAALPPDTAEGWAAHPKVAATVNRVLELWRHGEKSLVFCFYVETGRALRSHISRVLRSEVVNLAAIKLDMKPGNELEVLNELDRIGERLLRRDSRGYDAFRDRVRDLASPLNDSAQEQVAEVLTRFMRAPSFLVRFVDLSRDVSVDHLLRGLDKPDMSGETLGSRVQRFASSLGQKVEVERDEILAALLGIQTGGITSKVGDFDPSERAQHRETLMPNVRLANGGASPETRRRLMLGFNTPFFPEVLVASSVMAEGVDLHQDCRHVIHHDLDWNPSTLEQRTGRVDRIGSKAEKSRQPVVIFEPYLGGTHDEKMFRVVKDRERWFGIVMGDTTSTGKLATERQEDRVPLPTRLAEKLTMDLALQQVGDA